MGYSQVGVFSLNIVLAFLSRRPPQDFTSTKCEGVGRCRPVHSILQWHSYVRVICYTALELFFRVFVFNQNKKNANHIHKRFAEICRARWPSEWYKIVKSVQIDLKD